MTKQSFTPGPWVYEQTCSNEFVLYGPEKEVERGFFYAPRLAQAQAIDGKIEKCAANFRLIASAPDLLQCIQNTLNHNYSLKDEYKLPKSLVRELEGAIAKAEGLSNVSEANIARAEGKGE